jgi:hypothetical protein
MTIRSRWVPAVVLLWLLGCAGGDDTLVVSIQEGDQTLREGRTVLLTATVAGRIDPSVTWEHEDAAVAVVEGFGATAVVTAVAPGSTTITVRSAVGAERSDGIVVTVEPSGVLEWGRQVGTGSGEDARAVALDAAGDVIVAGSVGTANTADDAFVMKLSSSGDVMWIRTFGTSGSDFAHAVAPDGAGGAVVVGRVAGLLEDKHYGSDDAFVRRYTPQGEVVWTQQFGTTGADRLYGVAVDVVGVIYVVGSTEGTLGATHAGGTDGFVRRYTPSGTPSWTTQFGTSSFDVAGAVALTPAGAIVVAGSTAGALEGANLGSDDGFVALFGHDGTLQWARQFGIGASDEVTGVAVGTDALYVVGRTFGLGPSDMFLRAYTLNGDYLWTRLHGSLDYDEGHGVAVGSDGSIHVVGSTYADEDGTSMPNDDAFLRTYDRDGTLLWSRQFGTDEVEQAYAVATDASGRIAVVGYTRGSLHAESAGYADIFIRMYAP